MLPCHGTVVSGKSKEGVVNQFPWDNNHFDRRISSVGSSEFDVGHFHNGSITK